LRDKTDLIIFKKEDMLASSTADGGLKGAKPAYGRQAAKPPDGRSARVLAFVIKG